MQLLKFMLKFYGNLIPLRVRLFAIKFSSLCLLRLFNNHYTSFLVIFEYKVRLEKSLAEEKSSNTAVKQELQQRATREKTKRDKDSIEATRKYESLQQSYQLLRTEHQDLQDECKKHAKQALDETSKLETTLQDLRGRIRQAQEDKVKSMEHLKNKYLEIQDEKAQLENKYNELLATNGNADSTIDHLRKEVFQLQRELESAKVSFFTINMTLVYQLKYM